MSKLTTHQIRALVEGMETAAARDNRRGRKGAAVRRRLARIDAYRAELAQREAAGADPETHELQQDHRSGQ